MMGNSPYKVFIFDIAVGNQISSTYTSLHLSVQGIVVTYDYAETMTDAINGLKNNVQIKSFDF